VASRRWRHSGAGVRATLLEASARHPALRRRSPGYEPLQPPQHRPHRLTAQQAAVQATGPHISNATTPGYSRQRVEMAAVAPGSAFPRIGRGVGIAASAASSAPRSKPASGIRAPCSAASTRSATFSRLESLFNDVTGQGLAPPSTGSSGRRDVRLNIRPTPRRAVTDRAGKSARRRVQTGGHEHRERPESLNQQVQAGVGEVNRLASEVAR